MTDMNILDLFLKASLLVKLIMLILIGFSIASWAIIIQRTRILNAAAREAEAQMGQYRTNVFSGTGSFAPTSIPFALRLTDCSSEVYSHVGIAFSGVTPAEDPQVFLARSDTAATSGIGLALFDEEQRQIIPNSLPLHYAPILTQEMTFHFTARYRAISENMTPGSIHSDVWFTLVYP